MACTFGAEATSVADCILCVWATMACGTAGLTKRHILCANSLSFNSVFKFQFLCI